VTTVVYSAGARADLQRVADFLATLIIDAVDVLPAHPLIGHPVPGSPLRQLVIARGRTGYLALYEYDTAADVVYVLAIRHQREAGFAE